MATALLNHDHSSRQTELNKHRSDDCNYQMFQCSFCEKPHSSSAALKDHLMLCGNKTDQCPNCRKFIRRAIFAYHYENKCADLDEFDTPATQSKYSTADRPLSKTRKSPSSENTLDLTSVTYRSNGLDRTSPETSESRDSPRMKECKYCGHRCERSDYKVHKKYCLQNPRYLSEKQQRTSLISDRTEFRPVTSEGRDSKDVVRIPCEFCDQLINFSLWDTHTRDCQDQEKRRLQSRAETINREPVTEKSPCEYCRDVFSLGQLSIHERSCEKNPENMDRAARLAELRLRTTLVPSNTLSNTARNSLPSSTYSSLPPTSQSVHDHSPQTQNLLDRIDDQQNRDALQNDHFKSLITIDYKPRDRDLPTYATTAYQPPQTYTATDNAGLSLVNSSYNASACDARLSLLNDRLSSGTQSLSRRSGSATSLHRPSVDERRPMPLPRAESSSNRTPRSQSASRSSLDPRGSHRSSATGFISYLSSYDTFLDSPHTEDLRHEPKMYRQERSARTSSRPRWIP